MEKSTAQLILERLHSVISMDFQDLTEAEVIEVIVKAEQENIEFLENDSK